MDNPRPEGVRFGRAICGNLIQAEWREWWLGNGRGAYAAGTIAGTLTRRYHGLLIAPLVPPLGRFLVFAKADATLRDGERAWPYSATTGRMAWLIPKAMCISSRFDWRGGCPYGASLLAI